MNQRKDTWNVFKIKIKTSIQLTRGLTVEFLLSFVDNWFFLEIIISFPFITTIHGCFGGSRFNYLRDERESLRSFGDITQERQIVGQIRWRNKFLVVVPVKEVWPWEKKQFRTWNFKMLRQCNNKFSVWRV